MWTWGAQCIPIEARRAWNASHRKSAMPYGLILLVVVAFVAGHFVLASDASTPTRTLVAVVSVATIALPYCVPRWGLACLLAQVILVVVLLLHAKFRGVN